VPRRLEGSRESEAPGIKEQRALGSASAPDWPAHAEDSGQGGRRTQVGGNHLTELGPRRLVRAREGRGSSRSCGRSNTCDSCSQGSKKG
jgi:hypothetical protein